MPKLETLYQCPVCESEHTAEEWDESTEDEFGGNIMPMITADSPEYQYVCPTCEDTVGIEDIQKC